MPCEAEKYWQYSRECTSRRFKPETLELRISSLSLLGSGLKPALCEEMNAKARGTAVTQTEPRVGASWVTFLELSLLTSFLIPTRLRCWAWRLTKQSPLSTMAVNLKSSERPSQNASSPWRRRASAIPAGCVRGDTHRDGHFALNICRCWFGTIGAYRGFSCHTFDLWLPGGVREQWLLSRRKAVNIAEQGDEFSASRNGIFPPVLVGRMRLQHFASL